MKPVVAFARAFLREEDGATHVQWMYGLLLLLILAGISKDSLEREWGRVLSGLGLDVPVTTLLDR